jgi:hypothetical protein
MAITGPIEDQLAIRALHDNYADAVFRRDAADWGALMMVVDAATSHPDRWAD